MPRRPPLPAHLFRDLVRSVSDAVVVTDADTLDAPGPRIVYVNPAFTAITGYTAAEAIGRSPRFLQGPGTDRGARARMRTALDAGRDCREEILNYDKAGRAYWLEVHIVPLYGCDGRITHFAAIERDVTAQRRKRDQLERLAHQDVLTGLPNRAAFELAMRDLLATSSPAAALHTLVMLDLDGFKQINDRRGHAAGDALLRHFAALVLAALRRDDFVARLGGDEFTMILAHTDLGAARRLAQRLVHATARLATNEDGGPGIGVSAGVATFRAGEALAAVMDRADRALYAAKAAGKAAVRCARPSLVA